MSELVKLYYCAARFVAELYLETMKLQGSGTTEPTKKHARGRSLAVILKEPYLKIDRVRGYASSFCVAGCAKP